MTIGPISTTIEAQGVDFPNGEARSPATAPSPPARSASTEKDNMRASGDTFASELSTYGVDVQHHVLQGTVTRS